MPNRFVTYRRMAGLARVTSAIDPAIQPAP